jgi:hypothetical protein
MLKELSVKSVGHRIALLRAIHKLKLQSGDENIPTVFELDANVLLNVLYREISKGLHLLMDQNIEIMKLPN